MYFVKIKINHILTAMNAFGVLTNITVLLVVFFFFVFFFNIVKEGPHFVQELGIFDFFFCFFVGTCMSVYNNRT